MEAITINVKTKTACKDRGRNGGPDPPAPEHLQATVFLSYMYTGPDSLENHKATKLAFNVAPFNWPSSSLRLPPNLCAIQVHHHRETIKSNLHTCTAMKQRKRLLIRRKSELKKPPVGPWWPKL